jgi:hypothetical protein
VAKRSTTLTEIAEAAEESAQQNPGGHLGDSNISDTRRKRQQARRIQALSLKWPESPTPRSRSSWASSPTRYGT